MSLLPSRSTLFDDLFRDFGGHGFFIKPLHGDALPSQIKLDVKETDAGFTVLAELPGVSKDDIHVEIEGAQLTIKAEVKQFDKQSKDEQNLRSERYYGMVSRSLQLPSDLDRDGASAKYENGVLTLTLPKKHSSGNGKRVVVE